MTHYTSSKGDKIEIASMAYLYLVSAHKKAVATEERKHEWAAANGQEYSNPDREAEIDALAAELKRREEERPATE